MARSYDDSTFGPLAFGFFWEGSISIEGMGKNVTIRIDNEDGPPTDEQRRLFESFLQQWPSARPLIEAALSDYYQNIREELVVLYQGTPLLDDVPMIQNSEEIWALLSYPTVYVPRKGTQVVLKWECEWDDEHGVEVVLEGAKIIAVDIQQAH